MARHRRRRHLRGHRRHHRRRHMRGLMPNILKHNAGLESIVAGAAIAIGSAALLKISFSSIGALQQAVPQFIQNNAILFGAALGGGLVYLIRRKRHHEAARGNLVGALAAGLTAWGWDSLAAAAPGTFSDIVTLPVGGGRTARAMSGLIAKNPTVAFPPRGMAGYGRGMGYIASNPAGGFGSLIGANPMSDQGLVKRSFGADDDLDPFGAQT